MTNLPTLADAESAVARALDVLWLVRAKQRRWRDNFKPLPSAASNRSAYCIGATAGTGAHHEQCPGTYIRRRCTCACHSGRN